MPRNSADYREDFYAWTIEQARLLRSGELSSIDAANLAGKIEILGRGDRRELEGRMTVLLMHLLKWQKQSKLRSRSWSGTIFKQRRRIEKLLKESPSLRASVNEALAEVYTEAREAASNETGLPETEFPVDCPFTTDEVLTRDFLPER